MLKNFVATTTAESDITICSADSGKELTIMSIMMNGGENGGDVTLKFSTGFTCGFTIDAEDTIVLDNKINLPTGTNLKVNSATDGVKIMVSAAELTV